MRKVLVVSRIDRKALKLAKQLGIAEVVCNAPRFEGHVKSLPAIVVESENNPGLVLGVFNPMKMKKEELDSLKDVPKMKAVSLRQAVEELRRKVSVIERTLEEVKQKLAGVSDAKRTLAQ